MMFERKSVFPNGRHLHTQTNKLFLLPWTLNWHWVVEGWMVTRADPGILVRGAWIFFSKA